MPNELTADDRRADADMRREIVLRELNQGALAGFSSEVTEQAADLVLAALDRYDAWKTGQQRPSDSDLVAAIRVRLADLDQADENDRNRMLAQVWHNAPADLKLLLSELEAAQARLDAAAKVHKPVEGFSRMCGTTYLWCAECSDCGGDGSRGHIMWPCDTAKALGLGEEADDGE